jgi:protoheme ferro-lyase
MRKPLIFVAAVVCVGPVLECLEDIQEWDMQRRKQQEGAQCTNYNTLANPRDLHMQ